MSIATEQVETSARLVSEGWLPLWAGGLVAAGGIAWALWQSRREFSGSRRSALHKFLLPAIRVGVVFLAVWLLCQPRLVMTTKRTRAASVLAVVDTSRSMSVAEGGLRLSQRVELLAAGDKTITLPRDRAARAIAAAASRLIRETDRRRAALDRDVAALESKRPLTTEGRRRVFEFAAALTAGLKEFRALPAAGSAGSADPAARKAAGDAATRAGSFIAAADALAGDAELAAKEASDHPQVLTDYLRRYTSLRESGQALIEAAWTLQDAIDAASIDEPTKKRVGTIPVLRSAIANALVEHAGEALGPRAGVVRAQAAGLAGAMHKAESLRGVDAPCAVVVFTDGAGRSSGPDTIRSAAHLAAAGARVHVILCAAENVEPADLAVVAVDMPPIVVRDTPTVARVLVKNQLAPGKTARLEVRVGDQVLASKALDAGERGTSVVELSVTPRATGRAQWVFESLSEGPDALPGNERKPTVVDVVDEPVRVVLLTDRLSDEAASYIEALRAIASVRLTTFVAAAGGGRVRLGNEDGCFPATADDWKGVSAAVLIGGVPAAWRAGENAGVITGLRQAIEERGIRVLVHPLGRGDEDSWMARLGVESSETPHGAVLSPEKGVWWSGLRSSLDAGESFDRWARLGSIGGDTRRFTFTPGEHGAALVKANGEAVVGLRECGRGLLVFNGLGAMSSLRGGERGGVINAMIGGLIEASVRIPRGDTDPWTFPPQPVRGGTFFVSQGGGPWQRVNVDPLKIEDDGKILPREMDSMPSNAELHLAGRGDEARAIAQATGGAFATFDDPAAVLDALSSGLEPTITQEIRSVGLWRGWWPLPLLLALVSAEYLLRRRAGRVM